MRLPFLTEVIEHRSSSLCVVFLAAGVIVSVVPGGSPVLGQQSPPAPKVDFSRQVRSILSDKCFACHGPDEAERQAELRLDQKDSALSHHASGQTIVPGKSTESVLVQRILSTDPNLKMPPARHNKPLTAAEIATLKAWIDQGAEWKEHWAFTAPVRPQPPAVKNEAAVRNPIDRFVLARLDKAGLTMNAEADKTTLIRRLSFDLTGLPPTIAEIDAFVGDTSPDAYARLVDRLLDSPRFGEHMARYWLDAARYGDTHGLHFDNERSLWPYRNWVINAFNTNMPFDRFTIEQLAGDLLPNPTPDQLIATGFNRCNVSTSEGGSINDEVLVRYGVDRVETTSTAWLGLTTGCAVCHDHKYDPISQKEFYQLFAYFNSFTENAMDGNALLPAPILQVPTDEQKAKKEALAKQSADLAAKVAEELAKIDYKEPAVEPGKDPSKPQEIVWIDDALPPGAQAQGDAPGWQFVGAPDHPVLSGMKSHIRKATGLSQHFFTGATQPLVVGEGDKLFAYVYMDIVEPPKEIMLQFNDGTWEHRCYWGENVIPWGQENTPARVTMGPLPKLGEWVRLEVDAQKVGLKAGALINGWAFTQHGGTCYWDKAGIVTATPQAGQKFDSLVAWERLQKAAQKPNIPQPVLDAVKAEADKRNDAQKKLLRDYFIEHVYTDTRPVFDPLHQQQAAVKAQQDELEKLIPASMIVREMDKPKDAFVLARGAYDKPKDKVTRGVPAVLPPLPKDAPNNRLGFAQWLVAPEHPLTSRVIVNRFWQQLFGTGLVKTAEDFGAQGSVPSHPDLLDWLAVEFREGTVEGSGLKVEGKDKGAAASSPASSHPFAPLPTTSHSAWNVKALFRKIVLSNTYRQSSQLTPEKLQKDPSNELLSRGPRFRLDAEVVRDNALAIGGLLAEQLGGKSVRPYQPEGIWEAVSFQGSNTQNFKADSGTGLYRRSLYTFWKRTAPPASLATFDAPSREMCTVRRARTNTPLQALVLMNDVQYFEAAKRFALRILKEGGTTTPDRLDFAFRVATSRRPTEVEKTVLQKQLEKQLARFEQDKEAAAKVLAVGEAKMDEAMPKPEQAAWTMVANLLMNLDETVTKE